MQVKTYTTSFSFCVYLNVWLRWKNRREKWNREGERNMASRGKSINKKPETHPLAAAAAALTWALWMAAGALICISILSSLVCGSYAQRSLTWWAERAGFLCTVWGCQSKGLVGWGWGYNGQRTWMKVKMLWVSMQKAAGENTTANKWWEMDIFFLSGSHCGDHDIFQIPSNEWRDMALMLEFLSVIFSLNEKTFYQSQMYSNGGHNNFHIQTIWTKCILLSPGCQCHT